MIIFKNGNKKDLKNYRPICLLSSIYKVLTKVLTKRPEKTLGENQPREQAGFKSGYSKTDHTHVVNQLKEKCREYNIPHCIAIVDYEKAFDSVQTQAILSSLQEQGIEEVYIELLKEIYTNRSMTVHIHKEIKTKSTSGDKYDRQLYHFAEAVHGSTRKHIPTTDLGLKIDGEYLSHLRFADDILICTNTPHELQQMLKEFAYESENQGLKMNKSKTKVMI